MNNGERLDALRHHVEYLASPELEGRAPGTPGGLLARRYVEAAFADLGLEPAGDDGYQQPIPEIGGANLLGTIPGSGPHADRYVVIAAHYDHLGINFGEIHPGADDNASGVAVLLDLARGVSADGESGRSLLIASFDAEEPPSFFTENMGSNYFVANPTVPLAQIDMMVCLDLIGHPLGPAGLPAEVRNTIMIMGAEKSPGVGAVVDRLGEGLSGIVPRRLDADVISPMSDHYAFKQAGIPFLFFNVGRNRHYHTPQDTPEKLDYPKMLALSDYLRVLVRELAARDEFTFDAEAVDDVATLTTIIELGRHAGRLARKPDRVMTLVSKMEQRLEAGTRLSYGDRGAVRATMLALEEALA
ncbi:MAG: M28 family peptidase [Acidimicrobiia bacterium]|nr:M28 family peptidase [Acidimicrobiia bacterium]